MIMGKLCINEGDKYGRLVIIKEVEPIKRKSYNERRVLCKCDCGNTKVVSLYPLIIGKISSCGCYRKEKAKTHGESFRKYDSDKVTRKIHSIWHGMKCRCNTASSGSYERYGSKGVKVCKEWENNFYAFYNWSLANGYADGLTIDRIDSDGDYEPSNCRWVDYVLQANNRKTNVRLCYNGESHTIAEWSNLLNISRNVLYNRKKKGWSDEKTLTTPIKTKYTNN